MPGTVAPFRSSALQPAHHEPRTYITITNADYYDDLVADASEGETSWTISRRARRGDLVFLYCCAPISAIVAIATIAEDPIRNDSPGDPWYGHYFADMCDLRLLRSPLRRALLMTTFPTWRYLTQPRLSIAVPDQFLPQLRVLIDEAATLITDDNE